MHQLWKHPNGNWYVLHGPRLKRRVSCWTKDRGEAEKYLSQFIAGANEPRIKSPTVQAILEGYRDDNGKKFRGQDGLKYGVRALTAGLGALEPGHLTPTVIKRYAADRGAAAGTILREIGVLRAALGWAKNHNLISSRPDIPNPVEAPPPRDRWLTKDEARRLLAACTEPHIKLFITLGLMTAARSGAIMEAQWDQVDWDRRTIDFGRGHGNKSRATVKLNPEAIAALKAAKELSCSNFIVEFRGKPLKTVKTGFAAACRRAKLQGVTPHILRHSAATWAVLEGRPLSEVARMLGDSVATVEVVYAKWTPEYLEETVNALQLGPEPERAPTPVRQSVRKGPSKGNKRRTSGT